MVPHALCERSATPSEQACRTLCADDPPHPSSTHLARAVRSGCPHERCGMQGLFRTSRATVFFFECTAHAGNRFARLVRNASAFSHPPCGVGARTACADCRCVFAPLVRTPCRTACAERVLEWSGNPQCIGRAAWSVERVAHVLRKVRRRSGAQLTRTHLLLLVAGLGGTSCKTAVRQTIPDHKFQAHGHESPQSFKSHFWLFVWLPRVVSEQSER
jgi:hypothetical protein